MNQCKACQVRVKDWNGDDPKCAFATDVFSIDNWRCATIGKIRELVSSERHDSILANLYGTDGQKYATVDTANIQVAKWSDEDGWETPNPVCLWIGWYKNRGSTEGMYLMFEHLPPRPPTEAECLAILKYYEVCENV